MIVPFAGDAIPGVPISSLSSASRPVLFHGPACDLHLLDASLSAEVERVSISRLAELPALPDSPCVLLLDDGLATPEAELASSVATLPDGLVVVTAGEAARGIDRALLTVPGDADGAARALRAAFRHAAQGVAYARLERELARTRGELRELTGVGMALMTERDPDRLLAMILEQARQLTISDAASLYLVDEGGDGTARLCFTLAQNHSIPDAPFVSSTLPLDRASLAGYAALTCETLRVDDAYALPADAPYAFNRSFDERFGYRTRSMLVVPMIDHLERVVGVLQLINHKRDPAALIISEDAAARWVLPYGDRELATAQALAGQAAVSIENSLLYRQIERLFESFVKAAVIAVDQRDPTTAGHSVRVAALTCDLAEGLERHGRGAWRGVRFTAEQMRELRYAALLHDFGKVGVREEVLVKAKKLPPLLHERVSARFDLIRRTIEMEYHRWRADALERGARPGPEMETELRRRMAELDDVRSAILAANEPRVLPEEAAAALDGIARLSFAGPDGQPLPYVTGDEMRYLRIPKGSLDDGERREIESHVEQTYRFLTQIPWTGDLRNVAEIAYGHHEKLNGRGYPRGVREADIPPQTRIMTVADIFDALTASDRPYKRALPPERAFDILTAEAREGLLDPALVETLIESGIYRKVLEVDWKEL
jgi:HD-GYP domain-containing protein (c-di-GMP phosphodiesterase class II)